MHVQKLKHFMNIKSESYGQTRGNTYIFLISQVEFRRFKRQKYKKQAESPDISRFSAVQI